MKRKLLLAFLGIALYGGVINAQTLDEAVLNAALAMSRDLPPGSTVALVDFRSSSEKLNEYVGDELYGAIFRNRLITPIKPTQSQLQTLRSELTAGGLKGEAVKSISQLMGVQYLITGMIEQGGTTHRIQFTAVDSGGTVRAQYAASLNLYNDAQLASLLGGSSAGAAPGVMQIPTSAASIAGVKHPVAGRVPVTKISENKQYTGKVSWLPVVNGTFNEKTQYTAIITLTAKAGYTLQGVPANFFTVAGAKMVSNPVNSGIITAVFPATKKQIDPEDTKLVSAGASLGPYFTWPYYLNTLFSGTIHGTVAPLKYSFFDLGLDMVGRKSLHIRYHDYEHGGAHNEYIKYFYLYPFANYSLFLPFARTAQGKRSGGWYMGAGVGVVFAKYTFELEGPIWDNAFAMNFVTGFNVFDMFDISYTVRTDFRYAVDGKLSVGYVYRF